MIRAAYDATREWTARTTCESVATEPDPAARLRRWRKRVHGYCVAVGATAGYGGTNGVWLMLQRPNAAGLINTYDAGLAAIGMFAGLMLGLVVGGVATLGLRRAPEAAEDNE